MSAPTMDVLTAEAFWALPDTDVRRELVWEIHPRTREVLIHTPDKPSARSAPMQ